MSAATVVAARWGESPFNTTNLAAGCFRRPIRATSIRPEGRGGGREN